MQEWSGYKDSGRDRHPLDRHAEMCIRWLCPHERARRRGPATDLYGTRTDREDEIRYHGAERRFACLVFTLGATVEGCRRSRANQPLQLDDTAQDFGHAGVWYSGIIWHNWGKYLQPVTRRRIHQLPWISL